MASKPMKMQTQITTFHSNHGANILLNEDSTVAYRKESFSDGITFSESPLCPGEIFMIEIEKTEPGWTGHLRIGLTQLNPSGPELSELPRFSLPDLVNMGSCWVWAFKTGVGDNTERKDFDDIFLTPRKYYCDLHPWAKSNEESKNCLLGNSLLLQDYHGDVCRSNLVISRASLLPSITNPSTGKKLNPQTDILPTDEGSRIGVAYIPKGNLAEIHYIINGEDQGPVIQEVPYRDGPIYGLVDVYGATKQVRIVQLYAGVPSLKDSCRMIIRRRIAMHGVKALPLPNRLKNYLLYES